MRLWTSFVLLVASCSDSEPVSPINSLHPRLVAYYDGVIERTKFEENTNITFALSFTNESDRNIEIGTSFQYCDVYQREEFLLIYKWVREDNGDEKWMPYGKPYQEPVACPTINLPITVPARGETKVVGAAWNTVPENLPFSPGKYYTSFSFDLVLEGQSRRHDLKLEFEVY